MQLATCVTLYVALHDIYATCPVRFSDATQSGTVLDEGRTRMAEEKAVATLFTN